MPRPSAPFPSMAGAWPLLLLLALAACSPAIRGNTALVSKDYPAAVAEFKAALKANPGDHFTQSRLGQAYYRLGRFDKAVEVLENLLAKDPRDPEAPVFLGLSYLGLGQRGRGFDAFLRFQSNTYREVRGVQDAAARLRDRLDVSLDEVEAALFAAVADGAREQRMLNQH